jgi:hypothetical protein
MVDKDLSLSLLLGFQEESGPVQVAHGELIHLGHKLDLSVTLETVELE